jgi:hypothetical protein
MERYLRYVMSNNLLHLHVLVYNYKELTYLKKSVVNMRIEMYSKLPNKIKNIVNFTAFKKDLKPFLSKLSFYTINEFVSFKKDK